MVQEVFERMDVEKFKSMFVELVTVYNNVVEPVERLSFRVSVGNKKINHFASICVSTIIWPWKGKM